jgi:type IV secretion system protein VirB2
MKPTLHTSNTLFQPKQLLAIMLFSLIVIGAVALPGTVLAQDLGGTDTKVCGFFSNINSLLNMASIAVVTIAVVFAGYQIAFAHKRIADVAPILIGGLLIGAAGQIAKMLIGDSSQACTATTSLVAHYLTTHYA